MRDQIIAVTVLGDDRPGIVAEVTAALAGLHGNLEDSTMTLLRGHFVMVLLVRAGASAEAVEAALHPLVSDGSLVINARVLGEPALNQATGPIYALRVHGADRPGIVAEITSVVARHGVNIVGLGTRVDAGFSVLTAELQLPSNESAAGVDADLQSTAGELGVQVQLSPIASHLS
jgi:glycine cleavage system transcriptional repressor